MTHDEAKKPAEQNEDHRRWQLAQEIVAENTGLWQRLLADAHERPATSVVMAFGVGLIVGLVIRRR